MVVEIPGGGSFDPEPHEYRNAGGVLIPSVTQTIKAGGIGVDFDGAPLWALERAGVRGRILHAALHYALEGDLNWRTLEPEYKPVVKAGVRRLKDAGFKLTRAETHTVSKRYGFGGTPDLEGILYGVDAVVDAKSGSTAPVGAVGAQLSGYALLIAERREIERRPKRYCLRLYPDRGEAALVPIPTDPYEDEADFLAAVRVWHRQQRTDLRKELR